ncbi:LysR family transcriptional regulator [Frigidibacter sp. ROC022]|uniref:LysR family transcriptional regulator n=1 Tax=Frigidibacter sp. ROC022 TaxID=2971796 RepID=UPI00215B296E|nr:LysR family transcriptional regulator [Frigidibacter sp. ROC022]MCR8723956.1 LysR family transcriptional regulator [Frigidibacter sp. ROC022]
MENWDDMRFLLALSRHKTMSAAADALHTNVATVSRRVERAGQAIGVPLFIKDASGWTPTQAVLPLLRMAEDFDARLTSERNSRSALEGKGIQARLQIAAPPFFHTMVLVPEVHNLLAEHPRLELDFRNRVDGTGLGDADILLRQGRPEAGRVLARRLATLTSRGYRSTQAKSTLSGWVSMNARSSTALDLALGREIFGADPNVTVSLFEQKLTVMRSTGLAGILTDEVAGQLPDMVAIDPDGPNTSAEFWLVFHATRRDDPAVRVVTDWIIDCFRKGPYGKVSQVAELSDAAT